jgi:hypothetical protein
MSRKARTYEVMGVAEQYGFDESMLADLQIERWRWDGPT